MERQLTAGVGGLPVGGRERVFEVLELILGQVQPLFLDAVDLLLCLSHTHRTSQNYLSHTHRTSQNHYTAMLTQ